MNSEPLTLNTRAQQIKLLILDVDGVLTDGRLYYNAQGEEIKSFHARDGLGIKCLQSMGIEVAVISGRKDRCVEHRVAALGITHYYAGVHDKAAALADLLLKTGFSLAETAMMGDDWIDLPILRQVGLAMTVPEASLLLKKNAHYVTTAMGGHGAVREVCEFILAAQNKLNLVLQRYLV